jgi:hypothetical protein
MSVDTTHQVCILLALWELRARHPTRGPRIIRRMAISSLYAIRGVSAAYDSRFSPNPLPLSRHDSVIMPPTSRLTTDRSGLCLRQPYLEALLAGNSLTTDEVEDAFDRILAGTDPVQVRDILYYSCTVSCAAPSHLHRSPFLQ